MCCSKLKLKFSLTVYICIAQYVVAINMSYTFEIAMLMYCLERNARFNIPGSTSQVATQTHRLLRKRTGFVLHCCICVAKGCVLHARFMIQLSTCRAVNDAITERSIFWFLYYRLQSVYYLFSSYRNEDSLRDLHEAHTRLRRNRFIDYTNLGLAHILWECQVRMAMSIFIVLLAITHLLPTR